MTSCLIVCRGLLDNDRPLAMKSVEFYDSAAHCARIVNRARRKICPITHIYRGNIGDDMLFDGCRPRACEAVLELVGSDLLGHEALQNLFSDHHIEDIYLIGALSRNIFDRTIVSPDLIGRRLHTPERALYLSNNSMPDSSAF